MASETKHRAEKGNSLTVAQLADLRRVLVARKRRLLLAIEEQDAEGTEVSLEGGDLEDVAEAVIEDRVRAALGEHERAELSEIEQALARLDAGTYGTSEVSGRPIPFKRLQAVPWARCDAAEGDRIEHEARLSR
jgi:DnaK suppressor protein